MRHFELTEIALGEGRVEIAVEGELDLAVAEQLREAIERTNEDQVLIDLGACEFIDSTGIAVIVQAWQSEARRLVLHSPSAQVLRVLDVTGLTGNGLVCGDREEALSACAESVKAPH